MRDYTHVDKYLSDILRDVYPQPQDEGHTAWANEILDKWKYLLDGCKSVLDVGCGEAFLEDYFAGFNYIGVCLGDDYVYCKQHNKHVLAIDYHFLGWFSDNEFDLVISRHSLEHSPMPLIALMEWYRVAQKLLLVMPNPVYWGRVGRNHYSVLYDDQIKFLLERAGWKIMQTDFTEHELRYFCEK